MAGANLLGVGVSGLRVSQQSLATAGHNIANANTPGYTRQRVDLSSGLPERVGPGFIGSGVGLVDVQRIYDRFVLEQMRVATSDTSATTTFYDLTRQIDNMLADPAGGLMPVIENFFAATQALSNDPASVPARQVLLSEAEVLTNRFRVVEQRLADQQDAVNRQLSDVTSEINVIAARIAAVNRQILDLESLNQGTANDLHDQRDELIRQLTERVDVGVFAQDDGSLNVTVGSGQALVVGATNQTLTATANAYEPTRLEVAYVGGGGTVSEVSDLIGGGQLGGILRYRSEVLDAGRNAVGRIAVGLAERFNEQHALGTDLDGAAGGAFFNDLPSVAASVSAHRLNTGAPTPSVTVDVRDAGSLTTSDYLLDRTGAAYTLTRLSDGVQTTLNGFPGTPAVVDGLEIGLAAGAVASGDRFLIRPTAYAARDLSLSIADVRAVAAAAPVRSAAGAANAGTGAVTPVAVNSPASRLELSFDTPATTFDVLDADTGATLASNMAYVSGGALSFNGLGFSISGAPSPGDAFVVDHRVGAAAVANAGTGSIAQPTVAAFDPNLNAPVTLTFNSPPTTFNVAGAVTGTPTTNVAFSVGAPISFNGWTIEIDGVPAAGDTFTVSPNTGGVGDNRNALALASLQTDKSMNGHRASFGEAYGQLVTDVGTMTREAEIDSGARSALLGQLVQTRDDVSGVNLDEEAASLLRFQQAYQANAQIIAIADETFNTLLAAVAR